MKLYKNTYNLNDSGYQPKTLNVPTDSTVYLGIKLLVDGEPMEYTPSMQFIMQGVDVSTQIRAVKYYNGFYLIPYTADSQEKSMVWTVFFNMSPTKGIQYAQLTITQTSNNSAIYEDDNIDNLKLTDDAKVTYRNEQYTMPLTINGNKANLSGDIEIQDIKNNMIGTSITQITADTEYSLSADEYKYVMNIGSGLVTITLNDTPFSVPPYIPYRFKNVNNAIECKLGYLIKKTSVKQYSLTGLRRSDGVTTEEMVGGYDATANVIRFQSSVDANVTATFTESILKIEGRQYKAGKITAFNGTMTKVSEVGGVATYTYNNTITLTITTTWVE